MTDAEWLAATNPAPMLDFVREKASDRKLRLFAVGCCRRAWSLLQSKLLRDAVEVSERFADGLASDDKLRKVRSQVRQSWRYVRIQALPWSRSIQSISARNMVFSVCSRNIDVVLRTTANVCVTANCAEAYKVKQEAERQRQADLLRDIVRYPAGSFAFDPSWLTTTVLALATGVYDEKAFERLPILADALQDAGCDSIELLNHLRQPGDHWRGCWALDLILGKT